jgi:hypothetical protein
MKTEKELQKMLIAIKEAEREYYKAVEDNLKEGGQEYNLEDDMEAEDEDDEYYYKGIHLSKEGRHNDLVLMQIDKIRFNKDRGVGGLIEVHICAEDYDERDYWMLVCEFGDDDAKYIYDSIIW